MPTASEVIWHALAHLNVLKLWLGVCHSSLLQLRQDCMLAFEDDEFFLWRSTIVEPCRQLQYFWRWLGIGQATLVTWDLEPIYDGTRVTVTEEACNPPWD